MNSFYELLMHEIAPIFAEETVCQSNQCQSNAFGIPRASVLAIIKRGSYTITTFSGPKPTKLPTTENRVKELTSKLLGTHNFLNA